MIYLFTNFGLNWLFFHINGFLILSFYLIGLLFTAGSSNCEFINNNNKYEAPTLPDYCHNNSARAGSH
jgi:hypothetical protein